MRETMKQTPLETTIQSPVTLKRWSFFSTGNYPYVCARVRAKRASLLPLDVYRKLLVMDTYQITRFLGESHYKKEITELGVNAKGFQLIELALNKNIAEVYQQILGYSDGDLLTLLSAYLQREDVWNIKTILRGKSYHAKPEEIMNALHPAGKYPESYWHHIIQNSKTVQEAIELLKGNDYYGIVSSFKEDWETHPDLCENRLEHAYYQFLLNSIHARSEANRLFLDFIREEIDLVNIKTLLMTKYESVEPSAITSMILPGGKTLDKTIHHLINTTDFKQFLEELHTLPEYNTLKDALATIEHTGSLSSFIRALEKNHLTKATKKSYLYPLSILPILDYFIRKRIEVENLRILARAKEKGLPEQTIRELLVIP
jgi:V/A-type H+/Na+-transporting ATPase subunit C